ncbi:uncharacterized protein C8R40DRAFT_1167180 [Lentinula edodes]|uniref:uncharacterized protein n=1 Tax=Lentinula edodes TaxID=5353 RepID=UPI001E8DA56A|nr:uncharacterized protein C8R40DRAFT_1167180 [Lentinula edodes]KAH7878442.1 hypothetical protein C8R40DRAFT_1167180 [Lentinula edodes]
MDSTASKHKHVVVHAIPAGWGHNKPLCAFVVRMLEEQPDVVITYLTASAVYSKIMDEFKRLEPARFAAIEPRLNIMDIAGPDFDVMKPLLTFAPSLAALCSSGSVTCLTTKKVINGLPPPTLAIIDPFAAYAFESIRPIAGDSIRILAWWTATAGSLYRILGPAHLGGVADPTLETVEGRAAMKKKLLEREQIGWHDCVGNVVNIAGIEPSYDYEWFPQKTPILPIAAFLEKIGSIYIREADGLICVSANAFEPEGVAALKAWYTSMSKDCYAVGPLSIHDTGNQSSKSVQTENDTNVLVNVFLDRIQEEFGDKSLIYVSFGTVFWPEDSERVWAVIDGLIEKRQPFLFSHPSPFQKFPDEMKKKIEASGIAMELRWSPQELILKHPVTGWFITHGGWNSMTEAFIHRVPLIHWPFHADQPYNAMRMLTLKAGFELVEVRTGPVGARIPYKCKELPAFTPESAKAEIMSIVEKLKQEEGFVVRKNFEAVANAISKAWDVPDGQSRKDFLAMLKKFA